MKRNRTLLSFLFLGLASFPLGKDARANCQDPVLRQNVTQTAKQEGVDEKELLSIIAHESGCRYNTIAWNLPGKPETAKAKFLSSFEEAKILAKELIVTGKYRVDVGIGQINNEVNIQPKGWTLDEVLAPETALNRVAMVLKERGWKNYHSNNPRLAEKWQRLALAALDRALSKSPGKVSPLINQSQKSSPLLVFNASNPSLVENKKTTDWVIFGNL